MKLLISLISFSSLAVRTIDIEKIINFEQRHLKDNNMAELKHLESVLPI